MRLSTLIVVALSLASGAIAQKQPADCTTAVAFAAFDEHWTPLSDIRADQLSVRVGHEQQAISSLQRVQRRARIVFVLDGSGSMSASVIGPGAGHERWPVALQTAMDVVSTAPEGTLFGAVTIGGPGNQRLDPTADRRKTLEFIRSVEHPGGKGKTPLFDAIARAKSMLQPGAPGDALFLLTDGGENASKTGRTQLWRELQDAQVTVLGVLFANAMYKSPEEFDMPRVFEDLVERTGGELYHLTDDTFRADGIVKVIERLRTLLPVWNAILYRPYIVQVRAADKTESLNLSLTHSDKRLKSARLAYPRKLPACSAKQQVARGK